MLHLCYSNRTEALLEALVRRMEADRAGGGNPLEPVPIVVPGRNMERYLELGIAQGRGVAANLAFLRLEAFVREWLEGKLPGVRVPDRPWLEARVLEALLDEAWLADPAMAPVVAYVRAGGDDRDAADLRRVQLALRLAHLLEEYGFSRPRMIDRWLEGGTALEAPPFRDAEPWQRALFLRCLAADEEAEVLPLHRAIRRASEATPPAGAAPPPPLHVFGLSYVGQVFQWALGALAAERDVHLYALNPCMEFWEDVPSRSELRPRRALGRQARLGEAKLGELELHPEVDAGDTPALVLWGRPGREHVHLMNELTGCDFHPCFVDPGEGPLLHRVQRDILLREPERTAPDPDAPVAEEDRSIRVLACPGVRREVEAVADAIWAAVRDDAADGPPLRFCDVAVLVNGPDRELYLPHVEAVFAEAHGIPHNVVDLPLESASRVVEGALLLLDLPFGRLSRPELLDVLTHPSVRARVPDVDPGEWVQLCARLGIYHGADHRDHAGTYIERDVLNWDQGVRRLVLGAFMTGEASGDERAFAFGGQGYFPEEPTESAEATFALLVRSLLEDVRFARHAELPVREWATFFAGLFRGYLVPASDADEADLRRCLSAVQALEERAPGDRPVGYRVAAELLRRGLAGLGGGRGEYLSEGVTVSTLVPMRAIPFRVVFVLGLGEGRFPTTEPRDVLDLRGARRRLGDVSPTDRDTYAFLEALLCARDRLVLGYVARDELTGDPIAPSPVVQQLLRVIERGYLPEAGERLVERPPLRRYEPAADGALTTVLTEAHAEARARALGADLRAHRAAAPRTEGAPRIDPAEAAARLRDELGPRWESVRSLLRLPPDVEADERAEGGAPAVRTAPETVRLSLAAVRRFLECPLQGWARAVAGIAEDDEAGAEAEEDEPFAPPARERAVALQRAFLGAVRQKRPFSETYREEVARLEAEGRWPTGALAARWAEQDACVLDAWGRGLGRLAADPPVTWRFGPDVEHGDADRLLDPVVLEMPDPRPGRSGPLRVELTGRTQALVPAAQASVVLVARSLGSSGVDKTHRLRYALRGFFDHVALAATAAPRAAHRVAVLDAPGGEEGTDDEPHRAPIGLGALDRERARAWLAERAGELLGGAHDYYLPCEAVLRKFGSFGRLREGDLLDSIEYVRNPFRNYRGGSSRFGPVPDATERPAPDGERALAMVRGRFGLFFELADLGGLVG
ncbi:MAG: exodeoxyribonuclease V subunit gamma [Myxococcota bacterium]